MSALRTHDVIQPPEFPETPETPEFPGLAESSAGNALRLVSSPVAVDLPGVMLPPLGGEHLSVDDLRDLMRAVTETADRLHSTHVKLHQQVAQLQKELAEANAQLSRSRSLAALGEMAAGIAHEIRNPLGSIQLYAQMLREDLAERPDQTELCGKIDRAVVGLDAIVRDVLAFARNTTIRADDATSEDLLTRAVSSCDSLLVNGGIAIVRESDDSYSIQADSCLLNQALSNLVRNAIEAMQETPEPKGGHRLTLGASKRRTRCPGGQQAVRIVLAIQDTGHGIPPEVLERMFNPFFTTRPTGTGLGLAIVHRIVDAHGGHINVKSVATGGTRFEVCLPAGQTAQNPTSLNETFRLGVSEGEGVSEALGCAAADHNRFALEAES